MADPAMAAFLNGRYVGVFITTRPDGSPHAAPVWFEYEADGAGHGTFGICTDPDSVKVRNLTAGPSRRAAICVASHEPPYRYVFAEGPVALDTTAGSESAPHQLLRRLAVRYLGEHEGNRYADSLKGEPLTMITVTTERLKWYHEGS